MPKSALYQVRDLLDDVLIPEAIHRNGGSFDPEDIAHRHHGEGVFSVGLEPVLCRGPQLESIEGSSGTAVAYPVKLPSPQVHDKRITAIGR